MAHLRDRRLLVVLDNCEHLLEACRELVTSLVSGCAGVRVLCTSRERLGVPGEATVVLSALELPAAGARLPVAGLAELEALRLLAERAVAVAPGFALTEENCGAAGDICRRLDGLPPRSSPPSARIQGQPPPPAQPAASAPPALPGRPQAAAHRPREAPARTAPRSPLPERPAAPGSCTESAPPRSPTPRTSPAPGKRRAGARSYRAPPAAAGPAAEPPACPGCCPQAGRTRSSNEPAHMAQDQGHPARPARPATRRPGNSAPADGPPATRAGSCRSRPDRPA